MLFKLLQFAADAAEKKAVEAEALAEPALAFARNDSENEQVVLDAFSKLKVTPIDYPRIISHPVIAAFAALPAITRDHYVSEFRVIREQLKLSRLFPIRAFNSKLRDFVELIEAVENNRKLIDAEITVFKNRDQLDTAASYYYELKEALRRWSGSWLTYVGTHYEHRADEDVRNQLWKFVHSSYIRVGDKLRPFSPKKGDLDGIADALKSVASVSVPTLPAWIRPYQGQPDPTRTISFKNGILVVDAWLANLEKHLLDHTSNFFNLISLPFAFDPNATCMQWLNFLYEIFEGDEYRILALQCWIGILMTPDTSLQKIFILIGKPRSGKGTILRIIAALLGTRNVTQPKLASLTNEFGLSALLSKSFAAFGDVHACGRDVGLAVETLLAISGEDNVNVNRKYREILTDVKLSVRLALVMNEMIRLPDVSGALAQRLIVLPFHASFAGKENPNLTNELLSELPGIANWGLEGLRVLRAAIDTATTNGKAAGEVIRNLLQAPVGLPYLEQFRDISSPLATFLAEECVVGDDKSVNRQALFDAWKLWCEATGHEAGSINSFLSKLRSLLPKMIESRPERHGIRVRIFEGMGLQLDEARKIAMSKLVGGETCKPNS